MTKILEIGRNVKVSGTSFHGVTLHTTVGELHRVLGDPTYTCGDKTNFEWDIRVQHGDEEIVATVYDWKEYWVGEDTPIYFHIGGFSADDTMVVKEHLAKLLSEK